MQSEDGRAKRRHKEAQEDEKTRSDSGNRGGFADQVVHPAEEKSPNRPYATPEINVGSAGLGHRRAEFGNGQRTEQREDPADNPNEEH